MRFRQVDLLGVGAGAAVAVELAIGRPKVVRKLYLLGVAGKETAAPATRARRHCRPPPPIGVPTAGNSSNNPCCRSKTIETRTSKPPARRSPGKLAEFFGGQLTRDRARTAP